mgnify:CR=1 FL=1
MSQADIATNNSVVIAKLSNITGTRRKQVPTDDDIVSDSDESSDEDEEDGTVTSIKSPTLQVRSLINFATKYTLISKGII